MAQFKPAYDYTIGVEGGYSFDPNDRGGETYKGISRRNFAEWEGWPLIDAHKKEVTGKELEKRLDCDTGLQGLVERFYLTEFWNKLRLDELSQAIAAEVFDTAVNQGAYTAARYLQQALNLLNNNGRLYQDIADDGSIGNLTIEAFKAYMLTDRLPGRSAERNTQTLLKVMNGLQLCRYVEICRANPIQETFLYGWLNRV